MLLRTNPRVLRHKLLTVIGNRYISNAENKQKSEGGSTENEIKRKILDAALPFVPQMGWTVDALGAGAHSAGYPETTRAIFHQGEIELVHHFNEVSNAALATKIGSDDFKSKYMSANTRARSDNRKPFLKKSIKIRLEMIIPYAKHWPEAMALLAQPQQVPRSLSNTCKLIDDICFHAGDRSTNFEWYINRIGIAMVYKSTELQFIQDHSERYDDTWQYLDRRLDTFQNCKQMSNIPENMRMACDIGGKTIANMLGLGNYRR